MKNYCVGTNVREFFRCISLFSDIPENEVGAFLRAIRPHEYKKGAYLFRQGEPVDYLHFIKDGWVKLYRGNSEGEEGTAQLHTSGAVLGEGVVLGADTKRFFSAQSVSDTLAYSIPASVIKERAARDPVFMSRLMQSIMGKMSQIHVEAEHMALMDAPQRVACLLLRLTSHMIGKGGTFTFPYDKSLAAVQLGMKRETFSRALAHLKETGVKSSGSEVAIENFSDLSELCCTRCSLNTECSGARCMTSLPSQMKLPVFAINPAIHHHSFHGA